ncbi:unnamed protein product [Malus baccata var. baccata]
MLRLIPKMLALMAVQRHTAASRSASPWMREQQGSTGGLPMVMLSNPLRTLAQTPNLRVSLGQLVPVEGLGFGVGFGFGLGFGLGLGQVPQELTRAKKKRLSARKRASEEVVLDAISQTLEEVGL